MKRYFSIICVVLVSALFFCAKFPMSPNIKQIEPNYLDENMNNEGTYSYDSNKTNEESYVHDSSKVIDNPPASKEVFLTFDDGPCINNTGKILKILKDNNVKATFFIVGIKGEENPKILKDLSDNGMSIGVHTYSHEYTKIYKNPDSYLKDFYACQNVIRKITGREPVPYVRMPGGSDNLVASKGSLNSIKSILNERGLKYVDWNVSSGDAESHKVSVEKVKRNVITQCNDKKLAIVLMHDTYYKHFTVEALPDIIQYLKTEGFVFRTFDDLTPNEESQMVKMRVVNRVSI